MASGDAPSPTRTPTPPPFRCESPTWPARKARAAIPLELKVRVSDVALLRAEIKDLKTQVSSLTSTLSPIMPRVQALEETVERLGMAFTRFQGQVSVVSPEMARRRAVSFRDCSSGPEGQ